MTTTISSEHADIGVIKDRYPLADVVERSGVRLRGMGRVLQGLCPFHEDLEPSFTVYRDTQRFYCFGCGAMGDVLDFIMLTQHTPLPEAIRLLDGPLPMAPVCSQRLNVLSPELYVQKDTALLAAAARYYAACLWRSPAALSYLHQRGITGRTAMASGLGYSPGMGLRTYLENAGFADDAICTSGLFMRQDERFEGRIVVPEVVAGRVTWMTARSISDGEPRFQALPGRKPIMGLSRLCSPDVVIVAEGLFDWITLVQWGLPACATLGTQGMERVAQALQGVRRIDVVMDSDDAGRAAANSLLALLSPRAVNVALPSGVKDVAELATCSEGKEVFLRLIALAECRRSKTI